MGGIGAGRDAGGALQWAMGMGTGLRPRSFTGRPTPAPVPALVRRSSTSAATRGTSHGLPPPSAVMTWPWPT